MGQKLLGGGSAPLGQGS